MARIRISRLGLVACAVACVVLLVTFALLRRRGAWGDAARPNVFLLNIDMLRADHLGIFGYERATSPELDRLAREGVWFSAARSHAPWTYPSVVSLLSGVYPSTHRAGYSRQGDEYVTTVVSDDVDTMAKVLQRNGYATAAFVTNPLLKRVSGLDRGFDHYVDQFVHEWKRQGDSNWANESMQAEHVHRALLEWLDVPTDKPRFAYVHYIDVHGPYFRPRPFDRPDESPDPLLVERARLTGKPRELIVDVYDGEIRHLDALLGDLLRELDRRGILDGSIVIVTADHGEEFGDHGGHGHGHTLYEELLHVPLIVARTNAFPHTGRIDEAVGHVDILPTILDVIGVPPIGSLPGRSLTPLVNGTATFGPRPVLSELDNEGRPSWNSKPGDPITAYALVQGRLKYIIATLLATPPKGKAGNPAVESAAAAETREELYDLRADPGERKPLIDEDRNARARSSLARVIRDARGRAVAPAIAPLDAETRARLRALGYLPDEPAETTQAPPSVPAP